MSPAHTDPDESSYTGRFGARLRELRLEAGMSVEELAAAIAKNNTSRLNTPTARTIYGWEAGVSSPHIGLFPAISKSLRLRSCRHLIPES